LLNKFLPLEGRINTMIDLIPSLKVDAESLTPESKKWFAEIMGRFRAAQEELDFEKENEGSEENAAEGTKAAGEAEEGSEPQSE
jgi:hypothetical protein